jgi:hypothetical protein
MGGDDSSEVEIDEQEPSNWSPVPAQCLLLAQSGHAPEITFGGTKSKISNTKQWAVYCPTFWVSP